MTRPWVFAAWLGAVAGFILVTGTQLPAIVASHFALGGQADGFMPRSAYLAVMCIAGVALPGIIVIVQARIMRKWPQRMRLPNREYWLAPQRREATVEAITRHIMLFGFGLSALIAFVHWEVVQANLREPPRLAAARFSVAIGLFIAGTIWWVCRLYARFRRTP